MITNTTLRYGFTFILLLFCSATMAQNKTYAKVISSEDEVTNSGNSIDSDLATKAEIMASSGLALGVGSYSGHLELEYPSILPENTSGYIKIDTEEDLLFPLLGGSLASLLANITGVVLLGNQEFSVAVKNGDNIVNQGDSAVPHSFGSDDLRVVIDKDNQYYLAISPGEAYNRVRITNRVGSLIGLNNTRHLGVYDAFHFQGNTLCGQPSFTSYDGNGLSLDILNIAGNGVTDPHLALDGNSTTFSQLGLGVIGVAADIEQTIYFDSTNTSGDNYYIRLGIDPSLLQVGLANNIQIVAQNGGDTPVFDRSLSSLINVDVLGLLQNTGVATIGFDPAVPVDRITVRLSSLLNVSLDQQIHLYEVYKAPQQPQISSQSEDLNICYGSSANLMAEVEHSDDVVLKWYDAPINGNLLATVDSGEPFTTPELTGNTSFYVASSRLGCQEESPRTEVMVSILANPSASDINILGNQNPICSSSDVVLVPSSAIEGSFSWFFDSNATNPISDGQTVGGATFRIDGNRVLTISGLTAANSPYTFYTDITETATGCKNAPGDLKNVVVNIIDSNTSVTITSDLNVTLGDIFQIYNNNALMNITGSVTGNVSPGDNINIILNNNSYVGVLTADLAFDIAVSGIDLVTDLDNTIDVLISGSTCSVTGEILVDLPELEIDMTDQVFCATEYPTVADLQVNLSNIVFFDSTSSSVQFDVGTPLINGGVYYAGLANVPASILARVGINVVVHDIPTPTTELENQKFCLEQNPTISDIQINETDVVFYDEMEGGQLLEPDQPLSDGETYYAARVQSGCESRERLLITTIISENEPMSLSGESFDACQYREYTYYTDSNKENYIWTANGGRIKSGGGNSDDYVTVVWDDLENTSLTVSYVDDESCEPNKTSILEVAVESCGEVLGEEFCLFVYNEFTPNNDGLNDFFIIKCIEDYSSTVKIYNRNGNLVYNAKDYQNDWNGVANVSGVLSTGQHLPSGTYYYEIRIPELDRNIVGWLQLAR